MNNIQKPSLRQKPKDIKILNNENCVIEYDEGVFIEIENQINSEINSLISELERLRREALGELAEQREQFKRRVFEWQQRTFEHYNFLQKNVELVAKRNSLANLQREHVDTLSTNLIKHKKEKPQTPFMLFSCRNESILAGIKQSRLRVHPVDHGVISFAEDRIKDWKGTPETVALDSDTSNIYFSDPANRCVRGYDMEGGYIGEVGLWSSEMVTPSGIAILRGELFVSDLRLSCISKFNLREEGKFVKTTRSKMNLKSPIAITFNEKDELYVLDQLESKLTVLDTNLEFVRGFNLKLEETALPLDIKVRAGKIYILLENELFWIEEPVADDRTYKVTYNSINIPGICSNQHFCIDEEGNLIRTETNGQLIINAPDGREIRRSSFDTAGQPVSNLTGVCAVKKGLFVVAVTNKESILHIVESR